MLDRPLRRVPCLLSRCSLLALLAAFVSAPAHGDDKAPARGKKPAATGESTTAVKLVAVPDRGIQPQAVVDTEGVLHLVYLGDEPGSANIYYTTQANGATQFAPRVRVNSQPGSAIAVGSIRGAHLALGRGNRPHVVWNGSGTAEPRGPKKYDSPLLYARQADDTRAFEAQRAVNGDKWGLDGGGSVAADHDGNVFIVWHAGDGTGEENRRVWMIRSADDGQTLAPASLADVQQNGVCGCCGLKAFADHQGSLYVLYRGAGEKVNRDMFLLTSRDHGQAFESLQVDRWMIATCPMSSSSFVDAGEAVLAAWETDGQIEVARIDKQRGETAKPASPAGNPKNRKHPALAVNGRGEVLVVWTEGTGWEKGGSLAWQIFNTQGRPTPQRGRLDKSIPVWSFAAAYAEPDDTFVILH